jgi:Cyclic nucleotide-binding domain
VRERELLRRGKLVRLEPAELDEVVGRTAFAVCASGPREAEHDAGVVRFEPEAQELGRLDLQPRFLADLAEQAVDRQLVLVQEAAGQIPESLAGVAGPAPEQHASPFVDADRLGAGDRIRIGDVTARPAFRTILDSLGSLGADGTELPAVQSTHGLQPMSPRAVGATQHELSRIGLLATLPGETLARLAQNMIREDIPAGAGVFDEGEDGDRFYVVLSGMLSVSQQVLGAQAVLRPGDYFGEVALAMHMPRTASVRALTPATVASCDQATFDEFIRPLFADDAE